MVPRSHGQKTSHRLDLRTATTRHILHAHATRDHTFRMARCRLATDVGTAHHFAPPPDLTGTRCSAKTPALRDRDPDATDAQVEQARDKAYRAPLLLLLVVDAEKGDPAIDVYERMVSAGAAVQSLLLMATAQGFGSALTSGKALKAEPFRQAFKLAPSEFAPCFISIGTVTQAKPGKPRPDPSAIASCWEA